MLEQINVYYEGWGERWLWGKLKTTTALIGRPQILFEYSAEARQKGLELSVYTLPLAGPHLRSAFPAHQLHLPGPIYDALPDGWGMLLMDRVFKKRGLTSSDINPLLRLAYIGSNAMGALTFEPAQSENLSAQAHTPIAQLALEIQEVMQGEGSEFLQKLLLVGGSPQGARPKALLYRRPNTEEFTTAPTAGFEAWLIKFPAQGEHAEVCAIEMAYSAHLRLAGISTPDTHYFALPNGLAAFGSKRFDRTGELRIPMQTLASFTGANYRTPGSLDYVNFLRATQLCTNDSREQAKAFTYAVFNVVFNNRDDHPKNFSYSMTSTGDWILAPAYDVTFCEGPGGYHQMDVMGEALAIDRSMLCKLATETCLSTSEATAIIDHLCQLAANFSSTTTQLYPGLIRPKSLLKIQDCLNRNIQRLS